MLEIIYETSFNSLRNQLFKNISHLLSTQKTLGQTIEVIVPDGVTGQILLRHYAHEKGISFGLSMKVFPQWLKQVTGRGEEDRLEVRRFSLKIWKILTSDHEFIKRHPRLRHYVQNKLEDPVDLYDMARRIANVLSDYITYRSDWVKTWQENTQLQEALDLHKDYLWQRELLLKLLEEKTEENDQQPQPSKAVYDIFMPRVLPPMAIEFLKKNAKDPNTIVRLYMLALENTTHDDDYSELNLRAYRSIRNELESITPLTVSSSTKTSNSLLGYYQQALYEGKWDKRDTKLDSSIRFIEATDTVRELENIADLLNTLFKDKELNLTPDDVFVASTDIQSITPLINGVFKSLPKPIDFQILGRAPSQELQSSEALLTFGNLLFQSLDFVALEQFLELPSVGELYRISLNDVSILTDWLRRAGYRCGINAEHLSRTQREFAHDGTLQRALERLCTGYTIDSTVSSAIGDTMAINAGSRSFDTVTKRPDLLQTILRIYDDFSHCLPPSEHHIDAVRNWVKSLIELLFCKNAPEINRLTYTLDLVYSDVQECIGTEIDPRVFWRLFASEVESRSGSRRQNGSVTFGGINALPSISHKVTIIMGLGGDSNFPSTPVFDEFNLMRQKGLKRNTDPNPVEESREAFIRLLMSTQERVYLSYSVGRDRLTEPSFVVQEFEEQLKQLYDKEICDNLKVVLPLSETSSLNFQKSESRFWVSMNKEAFEIAQQNNIQKQPESAFIGNFKINREEIPNPLPLETLFAFFKDPNGWLEKLLKIQTAEAVETVALSWAFEKSDDYLFSSSFIKEILQHRDLASHEFERLVTKRIASDPYFGFKALRSDRPDWVNNVLTDIENFKMAVSSKQVSTQPEQYKLEVGHWVITSEHIPTYDKSGGLCEICASKNQHRNTLFKWIFLAACGQCIPLTIYRDGEVYQYRPIKTSDLAREFFESAVKFFDAALESLLPPYYGEEREGLLLRGRSLPDKTVKETLDKIFGLSSSAHKNPIVIKLDNWNKLAPNLNSDNQ